MNTRSGKYVKQLEGYRAFIPAPLPPVPSLEMDRELTRLLSEADHALGRLDGVTSILPNPDLFVSMYVRHEAVLSSQIEGTQSTLEDVLQFEIDATGQEHPKDVEEVVNYVRAMNYGLKRLDDLPLSLRLIREIHGELLKGVRGANRTYLAATMFASTAASASLLENPREMQPSKKVPLPHGELSPPTPRTIPPCFLLV